MLYSPAATTFQDAIWDYYRKNARDLPWRHEPFEAYKVLVSEIMLQQTQAPRVIPKYRSFLQKFPTLGTLAEASLADVLREWSGLGYNRRAKYLHEAAKSLQGKSRWSLDDLVSCKGIGANTAAAVLVYSYNEPLVFIETNIRTVYIHHFFNGKESIGDKELLPLIEATLDTEHPREFYYALMDYGTHLKKTVGNTSQRSKQYARQSKFEGSKRQIRGAVLRQLAASGKSIKELQVVIADERLAAVLDELTKDGLISSVNGRYHLAV